MILFFFSVFGFYFILVLLLISGWQVALEKKREPSGIVDKNYKISVVIPFRNEYANLSRLMEGLIAQNYAAQNLEVILIDDHSLDQSHALAQSFCSKHSHCKLLSLPLNQVGKKSALSYGIQQANGEIIVTTDADCFHPTNWLVHINSVFQNEKVVMGVGAVKIVSDNFFFSQLQSMELASLVGSGVATLSFGLPTMCNGANLSFRKSAYITVDGYVGNLAIPSGDDEFLMRKMDNKFPKGIFFIPESEAVVATHAHKNILTFIQQRVRWAGKWKFNESSLTKTLAIFIFVFQLSYLILLLSWSIGWIPSKIGAILLVGKLLVEFLFLYQICLFLKVQWRWTSFFALQFIYPVYVLWIAVLAQGKEYIWKGRPNRHQ